MLIKRTLTAVSLAALAFGNAGCGKLKKSKKSADPSTDLTISGSLSLSGESTALTLSEGGTLAPSVAPFGVAANELDVYCVTFEFPPEAGTGEVGADGSFSLTIAGGIDSSVGCFVLKDTTQVGTIVFEDPSQKSLSGGSNTSSRTAFSGSANLGSIALDLNTGKAVVDLSKVSVTKKTDASAGESFDFTGTYQFEAPTGVTQPKGYAQLCPAQDQNCKGPRVGESVYIKRIPGTSTVDGKKVFAVMAWESETKFKSCGEKLGFSYADAKTNGQVDFSASGVAEGAFTWSAGYTDGWKSPTATSRFTMPMSAKTTIGNYSGMAQFIKPGKTYTGGGTCGVKDCFQFHADDRESGCKDTATGAPVQVQDWSGIKTCTSTDVGSGLRKDICTGTANSQAVTCTHIGGLFKGFSTTASSATAITFEPNPQWPNDFEVLNQGAACSSIADPLTQLRCYADFVQEVGRSNSSDCIRKINFNYGAQTAAEFVSDKGPTMAFGEHVFSKFNYDSANSGSFTQEEEYFEGVDTGNGFTSCRVINRFTMSLQKIQGSSDLTAELLQESRTADAKPACLAKYSGAKVRKSMFKLKKM